MEFLDRKLLFHNGKYYSKVYLGDKCWRTPMGFYVVSEEDGNTIDLSTATHIGQNANKVQYSLNNRDWFNLSGVTSYTLNKGEKLYFKSTSSIHKTSASELPLINSTKTFSVKGELIHIVDSIPDYGLYAFFKGTKIKNCILYITNESIGNYGMAYMFKDCTELVDYLEYDHRNDEIDWDYRNITSLGASAFRGKFSGCSKLDPLMVSPLVLIVDKIPDYCFSEMYSNCTSMKHGAQVQLGTTNKEVGSYSYYRMYYNCKSLIEVIQDQSLYAVCDTDGRYKRLGPHSYESMYEGCTSVSVSNGQLRLPQPGDEYCFASMFKNCTSLNTTTWIEIPATVDYAGYCCEYMFYGCTSLTYGATIRAVQLSDRACQYMYAYCPNLKYMYCSGIPGSWSGFLPDRNNATYHWIYPGVASSGHYYYPNNMNVVFTGLSDTYAKWPSGWTAHAVTPGS